MAAPAPAEEDHTRVQAHDTKRSTDSKWLRALFSEASPSVFFSAKRRREEMCLTKSAMSNSSFTGRLAQ